MEKEIFDTTSDMSLSSTTGPNGFGGMFFKSCWHIINTDLVASIQYFLRTYYLLENFNSVHVILLAKVKDADRVKLYRPTALANF